MSVDFNNISQEIRKQHYPLIGKGSGRYVYDLGNGYVAKRARNRRGIAQNQAEYQIYKSCHSDLLARIHTVSDRYEYVIMEKADKINSMKEVWDYYHVPNGQEFFRTAMFQNVACKHKLLSGDLYRITSWGKINGKPVIIDYGYTMETRRYYTFF